LCPLDEPAGAALIEALIEAGDGPGALDAFARLEHRLGAELGVGVSARTAALVGPLRPAPRAPGPDRRVAAPAVRLAGRDRDLAGLARAWLAASGGAGAMALISGEGGIGKTHLAERLRAAAREARPGTLTVAATAAAGPGPAAPFAVWADALGDLAGQSTFHSNRVWLRRADSDVT